MTEINHPAMRVRVTFAKRDAMRYTSHLDLHRTWERTIRRADLTLAYSHGFNPRPKINLASALPLGFTSDCELIDIWLETKQPLDRISSALISSQPPGIQIKIVEEIDLQTPKLQKLVHASEYTITLQEQVPDLTSRLEKIIAAKTLQRIRRGKTYDLRPLMENAAIISKNSTGHQRFTLILMAEEGATGRPDEVLSEMQIPLQIAHIKRTNLVLH